MSRRFLQGFELQPLLKPYRSRVATATLSSQQYCRAILAVPFPRTSQDIDDSRRVTDPLVTMRAPGYPHLGGDRFA